MNSASRFADYARHAVVKEVILAQLQRIIEIAFADIVVIEVSGHNHVFIFSKGIFPVIHER